QAEAGIRDGHVTGVQTCALPISNARLYDTRHSHATALLNAGNVNLAWVSARLGHTSVQTTESYYARVLPEAHRQMAEVMENVWEIGRASCRERVESVGVER